MFSYKNSFATKGYVKSIFRIMLIILFEENVLVTSNNIVNINKIMKANIQTKIHLPKFSNFLLF